MKLWALVAAGILVLGVGISCSGDERTTPTDRQARDSQTVGGTMLSWKTDSGSRLTRIRATDLATRTTETVDVERATGTTYAVALSPDGTDVAWVETGEAQVVLAVAELEDARVRRLKLPAAQQPSVSAPAWSSDGRMMAVAVTATSPGLACGADRTSDAHLYVVSEDLSSVREINATAPSMMERGLSSILTLSGWSPTRDELLYEHAQWGMPECRGYWSSDLYVLDLAVRAFRRIGGGHTYSTEAVWSPDGNRIAYNGGPCGSGDEGCTILFDREGTRIGALGNAIAHSVWWTRARIFTLVETETGELAVREFDAATLARRPAREYGGWSPVAFSQDGLVAVTGGEDEARLRILSPQGGVLLETALDPDARVVFR